MNENQAVRERMAEIPEMVQQLKERVESLGIKVGSVCTLLRPIVPNVPADGCDKIQPATCEAGMRHAKSNLGQSLAVLDAEIGDIGDRLSRLEEQLEETIGR